MPKRTRQPNVRKTKKRHGFRARQSTASGQSLLSRRRHKKRQQLTP